MTSADLNSAAPAPKPAPGELMKAVRAQDLSAMEDLLRRGANVNEKNGIGGTPLIVAAQYDDVEGVRLLLAHHAELENKEAGQNLLGYTALMYAAANGYTEVTRVLLEAGASLETTDDNGETALSIANNVQMETPTDARMKTILLLENAAEIRAEALQQIASVQQGVEEARHAVVWNRQERLKNKAHRIKIRPDPGGPR